MTSALVTELIKAPVLSRNRSKGHEDLNCELPLCLQTQIMIQALIHDKNKPQFGIISEMSL